ncbi:MAG: metalloregulator ArsR/SmtB family transcription factor [Deinococcota bacterium]|nr:metalloregulator ArsR/SmtB family transcription factor [Deinococcota bacterium]
MTDDTKPAALFKALSVEHRLKILHFIATGDPACCSTGKGICACDVIEEVGLAQATVSHHMKILVDAGLVHGEKRGRWVYYSLNDEGFRQAQAFLQPYLSMSNQQVPREVLV